MRTAAMVTAALATVTAPYVLIPGQIMRHHSCVHHVPNDTMLHPGTNGSVVAMLSDGDYQIYAPCEFPDQDALASGYKANGYVTAAWIDDNLVPADGIGRFDSAMYTPSAPSDLRDGTIFLWTGTVGHASSKTMVNVLQPVLQIGTSGAGTRSTWGVACWYVGHSHTFYSSFIDASPKDVITTSMQLQSGEWTLHASVNGSAPAKLTVSADITAKQMAALVALEAYKIADCSQYPYQYGTYFDEMRMESATGKAFSPAWFVHEYVQQCNESSTIHDPTYVSMYWDPTNV